MDNRWKKSVENKLLSVRGKIKRLRESMENNHKEFLGILAKNHVNYQEEQAFNQSEQTHKRFLSLSLTVELELLLLLLLVVLLLLFVLLVFEITVVVGFIDVIFLSLSLLCMGVSGIDVVYLN